LNPRIIDSIDVIGLVTLNRHMVKNQRRLKIQLLNRVISSLLEIEEAQLTVR